MLLRDVIGGAGGERILYVDHIVGQGGDLLEAVNGLGGEGIVSNSRGSLYRGGTSRDWLKTKVFSTALFVITGFGVLAQGRLEAIYVAEERTAASSPPALCSSASPTRASWPSSTGCATDPHSGTSSRLAPS